MRCYLLLPVILSAVCALRFSYKKNVMFTLLPGKTACFHKKVSRYKIIEVEYQVLETGGTCSNMSISMEVIAPRAHRLDRAVAARAVAAQRGPAGAHVLDALLTGVYSFCFDNSFDHRNNKTILFNLTIRIKKKILNKKIMSAKDKKLSKKLKRLKNKMKHKEMLSFLRSKSEEEVILMPQKKGKNQMNSSNKPIKKKKKKKSSGRWRKNNRKKPILFAQPDITNKQNNMSETVKWFFDENKENENLLRKVEDDTQKENKSKQLMNNKIMSFISVTEGRSTNFRNQPEFDYILKRPIDEKMEEKLIWPDKENVLQNKVRANYAQPMNENTVKEIMLRLTDAKGRINKYKQPTNTQITRIEPTESQETLYHEDDDDDEDILSQQEEVTTIGSRPELFNVMETRHTKTKKNDFNVDNVIDNYPTVSTSNGLSMKIGDYPSIDYSADRGNRWLRSEDSRTTMWMPYKWDMID